jgi:hypothetical protein
MFRSMRYLAATALVVILAGCASGGSRPVSAPFVKEPFLESEGMALDASPPRNGVGVYFIPTARFGIGIVLRNRSDRTVVVTNVRAVEPRDSATDQIGTHLLLWQLPSCRGTPSPCAGTGFELKPFATAAPHPVSVDAGKDVAVALGFRITPCPAAPVARTAAPSAVTVTFRVPGESPQQQTLSLGSARLLLRSSATCSVSRSATDTK